MSGLSKFFSWVPSMNNGLAETLPELFKIPITDKVFVETDLVAIFTKILTDVIERTHTIPDKIDPCLWDNCVKSDVSEGLVTLLAKAMANQDDLFLVYNSSTDVLRKATGDEITKIKADYEKNSKSSVGAFLSFKNFGRTEMLRFYGMLEYHLVGSIYKQANLAKSVQMKFDGMRASVALNQKSDAEVQAKKISKGLNEGKDVYTDGKDTIDMLTPDSSAAQKGIDLVDGKKSFYLGMPLSYINGDFEKGLGGDSGEADAKKVELGLKNYFRAIVKPALKAIFDITVKFKSNDYRQVSSGLEALKTFELVGDRYISDENKLSIINMLLGVDSELGDEPEEVPPPVNTPPNPPNANDNQNQNGAPGER